VLEEIEATDGWTDGRGTSCPFSRKHYENFYLLTSPHPGGIIITIIIILCSIDSGDVDARPTPL